MELIEENKEGQMSFEEYLKSMMPFKIEGTNSNVINISCPRLEDLGEIKAIIKEIMNMDIFDDLSKHHERWNFDFKDLDEDKYYDSIENYRHLFKLIEDRIEEIYSILYRD